MGPDATWMTNVTFVQSWMRSWRENGIWMMVSLQFVTWTGPWIGEAIWIVELLELMTWTELYKPWLQISEKVARLDNTWFCPLGVARYGTGGYDLHLDFAIINITNQESLCFQRWTLCSRRFSFSSIVLCTIRLDVNGAIIFNAYDAIDFVS